MYVDFSDLCKILVAIYVNLVGKHLYQVHRPNCHVCVVGKIRKAYFLFPPCHLPTSLIITILIFTKTIAAVYNAEDF